jgi:Na+:H+ antiporter
MSLLELAAILFVMTASFGWINHKIIRLPHSVGLLLFGLVTSIILLLIEINVAHITLYSHVMDFIQRVDFQKTVLQGVLGFLLFAGAMHVEFSELKSRALSVGLMATFGVVISTVVVGLGVWWLARLFDVDLPLIWALVLGALISPTDPIAVLNTLKEVRVSKALETDMAGESLFNDGIGVVLFTVLLAIATGGDGDGVDPAHIAELFFYEALGGALLGFATGYVAYRGMRAIDNFPIEILISLALVTGTYALAERASMSGPISVVVAGLLIGNRGPLDAMSDQTQKYLFAFWTVIDEILNSVLFLLIGLEVLVLRFEASFAWVMACSIPLVLFGRSLAVSIPVVLLKWWHPFVRGSIPVLIWGGLRGGISVALALSLPETPGKPLMLSITYTVVLFTIVVQGLSLRTVVRRVVMPDHSTR